MASLNSTVSAIKPHFWRNPIRYCRWASHEKPAIFYSIIIGIMGPVLLVTVPPYRKYYGIPLRPAVPLTYPVPKGPRKQLDGYEDE